MVTEGSQVAADTRRLIARSARLAMTKGVILFIMFSEGSGVSLWFYSRFPNSRDIEFMFDGAATICHIIEIEPPCTVLI